MPCGPVVVPPPVPGSPVTTSPVVPGAAVPVPIAFDVGESSEVAPGFDEPSPPVEPDALEETWLAPPVSAPS